jgi:hypothetical protein
MKGLTAGVNKKALPKLLGQGGDVMLVQDDRKNCLGFGNLERKKNGRTHDTKRGAIHVFGHYGW